MQSAIATRLNAIPHPADRRLAVHVKPAAVRAIRAGHPWLFEDSIRRLSHEARAGDLAVIFDQDRDFLAVGLYDPTSIIRVRVLQANQPAPIDKAWLQATIRKAAAIRAGLPAQGTTAYRLVHGENDGLPGVVVDRYQDTLVLKLYTPAWVPWLGLLLPALLEVQPAARIVLRLSRQLEAQPDLLYGLDDGTLVLGDPFNGLVEFQENRLRFRADVFRGQKTGFFLDQRENRAKLETLCSSAKVLNLFAYTGGFSLYAARGGARSVLSVDLSQPALEAAAANFALNPTATANCQHETRAGDVFEVLEELVAGRQQFDVVVVDPPSFARRQEDVPGALAAYRRLAGLSLRCVRPGGWWINCSCTSRIQAADFYELNMRQADQAGFELADVHHTEHPIDHPVTFAEGAYLKCLWARVHG